MHSRLVPLAPAHETRTTGLPRLVLPLPDLPSMPWLELGFFAMMIFGMIGVGA